MIRDFAARYPKESLAHGWLAFVLAEERADAKLILGALKRCVDLNPHAKCAQTYADTAAEYQRPRCTGAALIKPLTASAAREKPGAPLAANGRTYAVDPEPFLRSTDFTEVTVDDDGNLSLATSPAATTRLADETGALIKTGSSVVLKLGDDVLLVAQLRERITTGQLRVTRGQGKPAFELEKLCRSVERPQVPAELKLRPAAP